VSSPAEIAAELVVAWHERLLIPLGYVGPQLPARPRWTGPADSERGPDVLLEIPPPVYITALFPGVEVPDRGGTIRCPIPGHEDRTPSFHVYPDSDRGWYCFGACARGGSIYDLGAILFGIAPRGREFHELRRLLARELLARSA
jgi:hypothetical protein